MLQFCFVHGEQVAEPPFIEDYFVNTDIHVAWDVDQLRAAVADTMTLARKEFRVLIDDTVVVNMPWAYSADGVIPPNLVETAFEVVCELILVEGDEWYEFSINVPPADADAMQEAMCRLDKRYARMAWTVNEE